MDIIEAILSVSAALETVTVCGAQNFRTMSNCIDTLHNIAGAIQTARNQQNEAAEKKEGEDA